MRLLRRPSSVRTDEEMQHVRPNLLVTVDGYYVYSIFREAVQALISAQRPLQAGMQYSAMKAIPRK